MQDCDFCMEKRNANGITKEKRFCCHRFVFFFSLFVARKTVCVTFSKFGDVNIFRENRYPFLLFFLLNIHSRIVHCIEMTVLNCVK